jgi:hypothetical protein
MSPHLNAAMHQDDWRKLDHAYVFQTARGALMVVAGAACLAGSPAASAHAVVGDRVFPATLTIDDPGVGDELDTQFGHIKIPDSNGDNMNGNSKAAGCTTPPALEVTGDRRFVFALVHAHERLFCTRCTSRSSTHPRRLEAFVDVHRCYVKNPRGTNRWRFVRDKCHYAYSNAQVSHRSRAMNLGAALNSRRPLSDARKRKQMKVPPDFRKHSE